MPISIAPNWLWAGFSIGILFLLVLDLSFFHRKAHKVKIREALTESAIWVFISLTFNAWFAWHFGTELGLEFLTGYLVEKSLSIDNLFVFLLIFSSFQIPDRYQHRILYYGILGAIVLRGILIILGAQLIVRFHWMLYFFGGILILTAFKFLLEKEKPRDLQKSWPLKLLKKIFPLTATIEGPHFFKIENGIRKATPLLMALIVIEATDLVFAIDSIPAVFAITQDAFVAFASNILALLGLRALYFVLADWISKLRYLKPGLALILAFIGSKMLLADFYKIPSWVSLLVVLFILGTAAVTSWYVVRHEQQESNGPI